MFWNEWNIITCFNRSSTTIINRIIANTFKITKAFSTLAASDTPLDNRNATKRITTNDIKSTIPPLVPKELDKEADNIISEGKIEDVIFYFDKLDETEKKECLEKLKQKV